MVWYGVVWHGIVWYGMLCYAMLWYDTLWYGMVHYGRHGTVLYGALWYRMACYSVVCHAYQYTRLDRPTCAFMIFRLSCKLDNKGTATEQQKYSSSNNNRTTHLNSSATMFQYRMTKKGIEPQLPLAVDPAQG